MSSSSLPVAIAKDVVVSMHYKLSDHAGELIESSFEAEPMPYLHGYGNIIPGLEAELEGASVGDKLTVTVAPKDGYGERIEQMVQVVPREAFQGVEEIVPGMQFQAETDQGPRSVTVTGVNDKEVTVDGNHPLAGVTLVFEVEVMALRLASKEELSHGHVHGPGGHHH